MALVEYQEWAYDHPQVPLLSASGEYLGRQEFSKEPSEGALDTMTGVPTVPPLPPIPAPGAK